MVAMTDYNNEINLNEDDYKYVWVIIHNDKIYGVFNNKYKAIKFKDENCSNGTRIEKHTLN